MRKFIRCAALLLFLTIAGQGCGVDPVSPYTPVVPASIIEFVTEQQLPLLRSVRTNLTSENGNLILFSAEYGEPQDCYSGCFYSMASGLQLGNKIGWISVSDHQGPPLNDLDYFDVEGTDTALFQGSTWEQFEDHQWWIFWHAFLPLLAKDQDSPEETLVRIAARLYTYILPYLANQLLLNPEVESHPVVLQLIACLPVFQGDAYESSRAVAQELLGNELLDCNRISGPLMESLLLAKMEDASGVRNDEVWLTFVRLDGKSGEDPRARPKIAEYFRAQGKLIRSD